MRGIKKRSLSACVSALACVLMLSGEAQSASLLGDSVTLQVLRNGSSFVGPDVATVSSTTIEFPDIGGLGEIAIDIDASRIEATVLADFGSFDGDFDFVLSSLDLGTGIGLLKFSRPQGIGSVTFTADSVTLSFADGEPVNVGTLAAIGLAESPIVARPDAVSEPATWLFFATALVGLLGYGSRRQRKRPDYRS